jgi:hypothetical protein
LLHWYRCERTFYFLPIYFLPPVAAGGLESSTLWMGRTISREVYHCAWRN